MSDIAQFAIGDLVHHKLFDYRGVVADVDPCFMLTDEWYENVAQSQPPKDRPWYQIFVHNAMHNTYVAERNLELDTSEEPICHPLVDSRFETFRNTRYIPFQKVN